MLNRPVKRPKRANIWTREPTGFYIEPHWCSRRLFDTETFAGEVWDPGCGTGRVVDAAYSNGYNVVATDLIDRGYPHFNGCIDLLLYDHALAENIVCNPPFHLIRQFITHALKLATGKVAMMLARRLHAAHWLITVPLKRVYLLSPRPSMPPGPVILSGEKPRGGTQDFVWLVFSHKHRRRPELRWLHRDGVKPEWLRQRG
jgi:hypothetical protein